MLALAGDTGSGTRLISIPKDALYRWSRSVAHCIRSIQELVSLGIRFVAATQNIDTDETNPTSRFLLHVFAAFAEPRGSPQNRPYGIT